MDWIKIKDKMPNKPGMMLVINERSPSHMKLAFWNGYVFKSQLQDGRYDSFPLEVTSYFSVPPSPNESNPSKESGSRTAMPYISRNNND